MNSPSSRIFYYFLYIALAGLAIEVLFLVLQNKQLKRRSQKLNQALTSLALQPGDHVQSFVAVDLNGKLTTIDYQDNARKIVLLVFSTECAVCEKNIVFWNDLFAQADSHHYRIMGIAKNDLVELKLFAESMNIKFPVLVSNELSFWWSYKLYRLPQTIVIDEQGVVERIWQDVLSKPEIEKILKIIMN